MTDSSIINKGLEFIKSRQLKSGCFMGGAGISLENFKPIREHPTIFFSSLILWCLRDIRGSDEVRKPAADFLLGQKSDQWTWNYWIRRSKMAKSYPYPDDLDDTARSMMALMSFDDRLINGQALANLAKLLIALESRPGGPYRTWLVNDSLVDKWGDIDMAVNANIGGLLSLSKVEVLGLTSYIDEAIQNNQLSSPYYTGNVPTIYFLSEWYRGKHRPKLKELAAERLSDSSNNALMLSLLITSCIKLGISKSKIEEAIKQLITLRQNDHWPAEAMYVDPKIDGITYYAGSEVLTTAFALEALNNYQKSFSKIIKNNLRPKSGAIKLALDLSKDLPYNIRKPYQNAVRLISDRDKDGQISLMADVAAKAWSLKVPQSTIDHLNMASINGWIAYTLYDDFLDEEGDPKQLPVANLAMRRMVENFQMALSEDKFFKEFVKDILDKVDQANLWEVQNARATINKDKLDYKLPKYGNYTKLAEKSLGHMLAAVGVLRAVDYRINSPEIINLQKFFHHFIIARQLNDDAHDWEADLKKGHLNSAVTMLLSDLKKDQTVDLKTDLQNLKVHFWQQTINDVSGLITIHIKKSRLALKQSNVIYTDQFKSWLDALEIAAQQALHKNQQARDFIKTFVDD